MAAGRMGPTRASATTFLIPPVALVLGVLVRAEHVAALSVVGGAVCVAGAWLIRRAQSGDYRARSRGSTPLPSTKDAPTAPTTAAWRESPSRARSR